MKLQWSVLALVLFSGVVLADDLNVRIIAKGGKFDQSRIEVPANQPFSLTVVNEGSSAIEFESKSLRQEKVIGPGKSATLNIKPLKAGSYKFFDEYHEATGKGEIVAR